MCGRYQLQTPAGFAAEFRIDDVAVDAAGFRRWNIAPTQQAPVVRLQAGRRELRLMRWGLVPHFARGNPGPYSTINARFETLRGSPAFRGAWARGQRCLVPAQGFYEWQERPEGKQPYHVGCADQPVFAFAGLWDASTPPGGEPLLSFTIITLPASPLMATIHNSKHREPAILAAADRERWLLGGPEEAFSCLRSYPDELRTAWPVSRRVNNPRHEGPELAEPVPATGA